MSVIIVRGADDLVMYGGDGLALTETEAWVGERRNPHLSTANARLVEGVTLPAGFGPRRFTYTDADGFTATAEGQAAIDAEKAALLNGAKATKRQAIDREHAAALQRGVPHLDTRWTATDASRDVLVELIEVAENEGGPVTILDADGAAHSLSLTELQDLRAAGRQYRAAARANRLGLHDQVSAATTVDDVRAVDETAGWPG